MKKMKKVFALVLCFAMIASVATISIGQLTAFAANDIEIASPGRSPEGENPEIDKTPHLYYRESETLVVPEDGNLKFISDSSLPRPKFKWKVYATQAGSYTVKMSYKDANGGIAASDVTFPMYATGASSIFNRTPNGNGNNEYSDVLRIGSIESAPTGTDVIVGRVNLVGGFNEIGLKGPAANITITNVKLSLDVPYSQDGNWKITDKFMGYRSALTTDGATNNDDNAYKYYLAWVTAKAEANSTTIAAVGLTGNTSYSATAGYTLEDWMNDETAQGNNPDGANPDGLAYSKMYAKAQAAVNGAGLDDQYQGVVDIKGYSFLKFSVTLTEDEAGYYYMDAAMRHTHRMTVTHMNTGIAYNSAAAVATGNASGNGSATGLAKVFDAVYLGAGTHTFKVGCYNASTTSELRYRYLRLTKVTLPNNAVGVGATAEFFAKDRVENATTAHAVVGENSDMLKVTYGTALFFPVTVLNDGVYKISVEAMNFAPYTVSAFVRDYDHDVSGEGASTNALRSNTVVGNISRHNPGKAIADATNEDYAQVVTNGYVDLGNIKLSAGDHRFALGFSDSWNPGVVLRRIKIEKVDTAFNDTYYVLANARFNEYDANGGTGTEDVTASQYGWGKFIRLGDYVTHRVVIPEGKGGKYKVTVNNSGSNADVEKDAAQFVVETTNVKSFETSSLIADAYRGRQEMMQPAELSGYLNLKDGINDIKFSVTADECVGYNWFKLERQGDIVSPTLTVDADSFAAGEVTATADLKGIYTSGNAIIATIFDADGAVLACDTSETSTLTFDVPENAAGYSVMLVDGLDTLRPIVAPIIKGEVPYAAGTNDVSVAYDAWTETTLALENVDGKAKVSGQTTPYSETTILLTTLADRPLYAGFVEADAEGNYELTTSVEYKNIKVYVGGECDATSCLDIVSDALIVDGIKVYKVLVDGEGNEDKYNVNAKVDLLNYSESANTATVIIAAYKGNQLVSVFANASDSVSAKAAGVAGTATQSFTTNNNFSDTELTFKVLVWNNLNAISPIAEGKVRTFEQLYVEEVE